MRVSVVMRVSYAIRILKIHAGMCAQMENIPKMHSHRRSYQSVSTAYVVVIPT